MSQRPQQHRAGQPNAIASFIDRYGWRAYALPVLALLTVVDLFRASSSHSRAEAVGEHGAAPTASSPTFISPTPSSPKTSATTSASTSSAPKPVRKISLAADPGQPTKQSVKHAPAAPAATACHVNTSARKVLVSIASQHAWMCAGKELVYSSAVTTGKSGGHATPTGTFKVQGNVTDTTLRGSDYAVQVAYWIPFNGDIGFHDASWQTMAFGAPGYLSQGSRGCIHMPMPTIAWLHKWVQTGQTVVVVRQT